MNKKDIIPPVAAGIFTLPPYEKAAPVLLGGYCGLCDRYYFPRPRYCRGCLGEVPEAVIGSGGTVYSFTVIRKRPPFGLPLPYAVGFVDMKETGLRIFCLLDPAAIGQYRIGMPVRLAVGEMGHDGKGTPCLRPYFTPVSGGEV